MIAPQFIAILGIAFTSVYYIINSKKIKSGIVYILMLYIMFFSNFLLDITFDNIKIENLLLLIFLLFIGFIPWIIFDKWVLKVESFIIPLDKIKQIKKIYLIVITASLFSIIYVFQYSLKSFSLGAAVTRDFINEGNRILPESIFTTFSVGVAACFPIITLLFFSSFLNESLRRYRFWLLISSSSYIFTSMAFTARDGIIILGVILVAYYIIFSKSIFKKAILSLKKMVVISIVALSSILLIYSIDRFYSQDNNTKALLDGSLGYICQQPYVFDMTLRYQDNFHGFNLRFPILNKLFLIQEKPVFRQNKFETMFGTMYSEFYSVNGYMSLLILSFSFVCFYSLSFKYLIKKNKTMGILMMFSIYLYIVISGLFYFRMGASLSMNILCVILSVLPFFIKNFIQIKYK